MVDIITLETQSLGDRSYLAHDGSVAFVVDPQRDIDRVLDLATELGVQVVAVFETHIHNDYVTGGHALAEQAGAKYYVNAADPVTFQRDEISDGDVVEISPAMSVRAIATPGHTYTHLSYALIEDGVETAVFTGGSLLYGSTGRPDLLGPDHKHALAKHQYASAHRLADELPETTEVLPTHGFGSFCSATQTSGSESTIAREKQINPAFQKDEEEWIADLMAGLDAFPAYYAHMGPANLLGPDAPDLSEPALADKAAITASIEAGEWVVDLRHRVAFAAGHVPGSFSVDLSGQFSTYLGWIIPWGTPLTLLGETPEQVAEAQRELVRIGIDRLQGAATGDPEDWTDRPLATTQAAKFADLRDVRHHREVTIIDTRRQLEWDEGHIDGAFHLPLHDIVKRLDELPDGELWVHCKSGYRASIATSVITASGRHAVWINDNFDNAEGVGLPIVS